MDTVYECGVTSLRPGTERGIPLDYNENVDPTPFINTRCRLQRLKDAKFFAGWVKDLTKTGLLVRLSTQTALVDGDIFSVEVHGTDRSAIFRAKLASQKDDEVCFAVSERMVIMPTSERARLAVEGITGYYTFESETVAFRVSDISFEGCGLIVAAPVKRGIQVNLFIDSPHGLIGCSGEVRYCKPAIELPGSHRVGVKLKTLGRLEAARWTKMFEFYSAA